MSIYAKIYDNLCESRKTRISEYGAHSGIHRHHIVPKHMGGTDELNNFTYLTPREHQIAHFLLWKIHKTPNDLRSMRMLGAKLSVEKRRIVGLWCVENKIGIHSPDYTKEQRKETSRKSGLSATEKKAGIHNPMFANEYRKYAGKKSGKKSWRKKTNLFDAKYDRLRTEWAKKAAAASNVRPKKGIRFMSRDGVRKRVYADEQQQYLTDGWRFEPRKTDSQQHPMEIKGSIYINNSISNKRIRPEELHNFLEDGWVRGMCTRKK